MGSDDDDLEMLDLFSSLREYVSESYTSLRGRVLATLDEHEAWHEAVRPSWWGIASDVIWASVGVVATTVDPDDEEEP